MGKMCKCEMCEVFVDKIVRISRLKLRIK